MGTKKTLAALSAPVIVGRNVSHRRVSDATRGQSAARAIGALAPGCEIFGFTKGQFSLIHLIDAIIDQVGAADVFICTWSAADGDVDLAKQWLESGRIRSLRMLVDYSFPRRKPDVCELVRRRFGDDALRVTVTHAKFVLMRVEDWRIVIRTSMNLTHNPRFENFEISDDAAMFGFLQSIVDEIWQNQKASEGFRQKPADNVKDWKGLFGPGATFAVKDARDIL